MARRRRARHKRALSRQSERHGTPHVQLRAAADDPDCIEVVVSPHSIRVMPLSADDPEMFVAVLGPIIEAVGSREIANAGGRVYVPVFDPQDRNRLKHIILARDHHCEVTPPATHHERTSKNLSALRVFWARQVSSLREPTESCGV